MPTETVRTSQRKEYEKQRRKELRERRKAWQRDGISMEEQFGPGTHGCHEAFHVSHMIVELIQKELLEHSAVLLDPEWYAQVAEAQDSLYQAYLHAGRFHLDTPKENKPENRPPPRPVGVRKATKASKTIQ
jgi:hypothetical protein